MNNKTFEEKISQHNQVIFKSLHWKRISLKFNWLINFAEINEINDHTLPINYITNLNKELT